VSDGHVLAIGNPPAFRQQVARAATNGSEAVVEWMPSVVAAEEALLLGDAPPDVVVISPGIKDADAFGLLGFVNQVSPTTALILVRDRTEASLLSAAMRAGAPDVVDLSKGAEELRLALAGALGWSTNLRSGGTKKTPAYRRRGVLVPVFSSKGGTGKSFLASNLSAAISHKWAKDVALVDLDFEMGDAFSYFGKDPTNQVDDLLAMGDRAEKETVQQFGTSFAGHLWGFGAPMDPAAPAVAGEKAGKLLRLMRSTFDYTIVDCPATYADHVLAAFDLADWICLLTGLDVVGLRHLSMALDTLVELGLPRDKFRVVLNRADSKVGLTVESVEKVLDLRVYAKVPSSRLVPASLNNGVPVCLEEPKSPVGQAVYELASRLTGLPLIQDGARSKRGWAKPAFRNGRTGGAVDVVAG